MNEYKYPIKYTYKKLYNKNGHIDGYIVCKVYLIKEEKVYYPDGSSKENYKVVYPYYKTGIDFDILNDFENERRYPHYIFKINDKFDPDLCCNAKKVDRVFDTYSECKEYVEYLNIFIRKILNSEEKINLEEIHKNYKIFEGRLLELTSDMVIPDIEKVYQDYVDREEIEIENACYTLKKFG